MSHRWSNCARDCDDCRRLRRAALEVAARQGVGRVTDEAIAATAGLQLEAVYEHGPGSVSGWLTGAYVEAATALRIEFELGFAPARDWRDGMRWATQSLVSALIADPACASYCFVQAPSAGRELRLLDARARDEWVALVEREYHLREPGAPVPHGRLGLACDTIAHAVAAHARSARLHELPAALDAVVTVAAGR